MKTKEGKRWYKADWEVAKEKEEEPKSRTDERMELRYCKKCMQITYHKQGKCLKCQ